jgi:hypothetical protein
MRVLSRAVVVAIALLVAYVGYSCRFQIAAKVWHWRHGNFVAVGNYEMPVPDQWLVSNEDSKSALLTNTAAPPRWKGFQSNATILASSLSAPPRDLNFWVSREQQRLEQNGVRVVEQRTLGIANESLYCLGGSELRDAIHIPGGAVISLQCRSTGTLSLIFTGREADVTSFYALVGRIRKRN